MPVAEKHRWTIDEVERLIEQREGYTPRCELVEGELDTVTRLLLAAEVLSPASVRHDRITKRRLFHQHGVPEYWVVDGDAEAFEVWHPGDRRGELLDGQISWRTESADETFTLDIKDFFASVADEA